MGKTKFCDQIKTGLVPKEASQYWFKDLKNITSDTSFDKKLIRKIKKKLKRTDTDTNLYVFLDGLDEGILMHLKILKNTTSDLNLELPAGLMTYQEI